MLDALDNNLCTNKDDLENGLITNLKNSSSLRSNIPLDEIRNHSESNATEEEILLIKASDHEESEEELK